MLAIQTIWWLHEIILPLRFRIASEMTRERTDEYVTFSLDGLGISLFKPYPIQFPHVLSIVGHVSVTAEKVAEPPRACSSTARRDMRKCR